jgi:hypothetical protein
VVRRGNNECMVEGTEVLTEGRVRGALPDGFKMTLYDTDRLRQLANADLSNLTDVVDDYGNSELMERHIIRNEIQRVMTSYVTPERTLELPATGLEFEHLQRFAAYYKQDADTPSGTIKDERRAGPDDIVFTFASPEVYEEISGTSQDTFEQTGLSAGNTLDLVGDAGVDEAANSSDATLSLDDDEMLYFTGDFIDLGEGQSEVTKIEWADIDGESYGPDSGLFSARLSGAHLFAGQGAWVKSTADLDAKVYAGGDAEIVPVAFYMGPGTKAPSLV